ncbi:odorant-binding protein 59a [Maniola jurtina]|uniref:odorant-binding protein 59a n=1 Tax=Maniola jurtina TaxID=191418 RepID=UPI001E68A814|nr:odorant-binding protein 59a [Maniola jurtina]
MLYSNQRVTVKMVLLVHCAFLFLFIMECYTLTCRSEHGPKNEELKKVFNNCVRQQQGKSSENRRQSSENEWGNRGENQRNQWERDNRNENRDERMGNRDNKRDRERNKDYRGNSGRNDGTNSNMDENRRDGRYNGNNGRDNRMGNTNGMGKGNSGGRNDMTNGYGTTERLRGQDEFLQSEEYGDASQNNYYASIKPPTRYKREKRVEMNSGQRSQYNPHSQRNNGNRENDNGDGRNSSENNSSNEIDKACVLHCFMENLHMTDDRGMPDRYLVTHALTKDEKNEDLRDFLQESIEECFQILDNENTEDKCEFSKNLLTCLSEKGRANCDDWNGKPSFLF